MEQEQAFPYRQQPARMAVAGMRKWFCSAGLLALLLIAQPGLAQDNSRGFAMSELRRGDGLPSNQVHAIVQGPTGAMWMAGPAGLSRYDGSRIKVFGPRDGLTTQGIRSLFVGGDGTLWIGHDRGVDLRAPDGGIEPLMTSGWTFGFVDSLIADANGAWIGTPSGLVRWTPESGANLVESGPNTLVSEMRVVHGRAWASGPVAGLWALRNDEWQRLEANRWQVIAPINAIAAGPKQTIWLGGARGVARIDSDGELLDLLENGSESESDAVSSLLAVDDELWIARSGRLDTFVQSEAGWRSAGVLTDSTQINDLRLDIDANVWIATDSDGVARVSVLRRAISQWQQPCETRIYAIRSTPGGGFLVGGEQCSWQMDGLAQPPRRFDGLDNVNVWDLIQASDGDLWAATQKGVYRARPGNGFIADTLGSELDRIPGRALLQRNDTVWVATIEGLFTVDEGIVSEVLDPQGGSLGYVYTLIEDDDGRLWIGTLGRGAWKEDERGELQPLKGGLLAENSNVYAIAFGDAGLVGLIQDESVLVLREGEWHRMAPATRDNVGGWSLLFVHPGELWVGSNSGLLQYEPRNGELIRQLTATMGIAGDEFTTSRSLARSEDGNLLLGMDSGMSVVNPAALGAVSRVPEPRLSEVNWSQAEFVSLKPVHVESGPWTLELLFSSSWFVDEQGLLYRHRLVGFDREWSAPLPGSLAMVHYTGLMAGDYVLLAQAFTPLFGWGPETELYRFSVAPPWWASPGAIVLWTLLAIAFVMLSIQWRTKLLRARALALEATVRRRTAELRIANKELEHLASIDSLTGLMNRRAFWIEAGRYRAISSRQELLFGLILMDLDHFKEVNDNHGHPVGDAMLCHVGTVIGAILREGEFVARWGGEEYAVLLAPTRQAPDLEAASERIRKAVADQPLPLEDGSWLKVTCSVGACLWTGPDLDLESLIKRADQALYQAKRTRNCSVVWRNQSCLQQ